MADYVIAESYTLPSKGLVYTGNVKVNPNIKIRSMTTEEEMKRLGYTEQPYKMLSEIIDDCLVEKPGISTYDMYLGDYEFLLHKLRVVTYGSDYKIQYKCPICGSTNNVTINLNDIEVNEYSDDMSKLFHITLPQSQKIVDLKLQTPRMLDEINSESEKLKSKSSNMVGEPAILFNVKSLIDKVDGQLLDDVKLEQFVRHLSMRDVNYILRSIDKIKIGVSQTIKCKCPKCKENIEIPFPLTSEFFRPSID